jgi:FHS family L-fucose permease-like MFS transporter
MTLYLCWVLGAYFILSRLNESHASSAAVRYPYLGIPACSSIKPQAGSTFSDTGEKKSVLSFRNLNFGIVAIFLYVGAEVSIGTFLPTISVIRYI